MRPLIDLSDPGRPVVSAADVSGALCDEASRSFALATWLERWSACPHGDLAASDSQTLPMSNLLAHAAVDDLRRWHQVGLGYADPRGAEWLRVAIAARHPKLGADDVLACAGSQEALMCVVRALLRPRDHAVVVVPIYQPSEVAVTSICEAAGVPLDADRDWRLDLDRLAAAIRPHTRLVLVNFPNSPTGASIDPAIQDALITFCRQRGLWLVVDEIYRQTQTDNEIPSIVDRYERGISINGLSKGFGLPGLRVGWAACRDREVLHRALLQKGLLSSCLTGASEILAHVALSIENRILHRTRAIGLRNHRRLQALVDHHPDLFEPDRLRNLAFAYRRFRGPQGTVAFASTVAQATGVIMLPSVLWQTKLGPVPTNGVRIGLGRIGSGAALKILAAHLRGHKIA